MSKRKYNLVCDLGVVKRFFFWGIFTNKKRLEHYTIVKASRFIDGTLEINGETVKGKIAEFDVSDEVFYCILGRLAIIECNNYILSIDYHHALSETGKEYRVMVYIYARQRKYLGYY